MGLLKVLVTVTIFNLKIKVMDYSSIIGIDISKLVFDLRVLPSERTFKADNDESGFKLMFKWLKKECKLDPSSVLFAFEHTGYYSHKLAITLQHLSYSYVMLPGLEIKLSRGIKRAKTDPIDAHEIAKYVDLRKKIITPTLLPEQDILELNSLISLRDRLVRQRAGFKVTLSESKRAFSKKERPVYYKSIESMINKLTAEIKVLEEAMMEIVENNPELNKQYELITSIKGVGMITALNMIGVTCAFTKFSNWRKFACYSGVAPFPHRSGTSIKGKTKISHLGNKKLKSLLGNITGCAIQHNTEMKKYYKRRLEDGKNNMSTQNAIRNKILARIFAVVKRGTPYVDTLKYAA